MKVLLGKPNHDPMDWLMQVITAYPSSADIFNQIKRWNARIWKFALILNSVLDSCRDPHCTGAKADNKLVGAGVNLCVVTYFRPVGQSRAGHSMTDRPNHRSRNCIFGGCLSVVWPHKQAVLVKLYMINGFRTIAYGNISSFRKPCLLE